MAGVPADTLAIQLVQLNQRVGDLRANADRMLAEQRIAGAAGADLVVFPEMQLIGYPPEDLVLKPALHERAAAELIRMTREGADGPAMLVGTVVVQDGRLHNAVALLDGGHTQLTLKHELPNYGVFDEKRVFAPGPLPEPLDFRGLRLGVPVCEDLWFARVPGHLKDRGAEVLIAPHGSPFEVDKDDRRLDEIAAARVRETRLPLVFLNRVGGQDEVVFDGASFVVNGDGTLALGMADWEEERVLTRWTRGAAGWRCEPGEVHPLDPSPLDAYHALVVAVRDYVERNRFPGVILGLSGGIDSALTAAVAADAIGAERVWAVMLPSRYTGRESLEDAAECARLIGCRHDVVPIEPAVEAYASMLGGHFAGTEPGLAEENIQSRARMQTLMALSNKFGPMLLSTANKSELGTGYGTLYGDLSGGYGVLKDVYKTQVFALSRLRNEGRPPLGRGPDGPVMPERVITKPPSAELRPDQRDEDSLPAYARLDRILHGFVEEELDVDAIAARGFDRAEVARVEQLLAVSEYKRRQAPPGPKISRRNFGRDRRYPLTHAFRTA